MSPAIFNSGPIVFQSRLDFGSIQDVLLNFLVDSAAAQHWGVCWRLDAGNLVDSAELNA
jgi:hypothetical protein